MNSDLIELKGDPFIIDLMYARADNMFGRAVYLEIGFGNHALFHRDMWQKLQALIPLLQQHNLKLKICDAYRPPLAHQKMLELIPQKGFLAQTPDLSQHCHGTAVDAVLTDISGRELEFPTKVDGYAPQFFEQVQAGNFVPFFKHLQKANHNWQQGLSAAAVANRKLLCELMTSAGLEALPHEWWHYNLPDGNSAAYPLIDWQS